MLTCSPLMLTLRARSQCRVPRCRAAGVVRGHLAGGVIEQDAYHFLGDVPVDQPGSEGVAPLVGCEVNRSAVLVAGFAALKPEGELSAIGVGAQGANAIGVHSWGPGTARGCRRAIGAGSAAAVRRSRPRPPHRSALGLRVSSSGSDSAGRAPRRRRVSTQSNPTLVASPTRRPQRMRMIDSSRLSGLCHRSRLAGCSTWAMICSARARGRRSPGLGKSSG